MKFGYRSQFMLCVQDILPEKARIRSVELLTHHLAAAIDLRSQVKQAFWNMYGIRFSAVHFLFDKLAIEIEVYTDLIAERAVRLGGAAHGTVREATERSFLAPYPLGAAAAREHVFALSRTTAAFGDSIREAIGLSMANGDIVTTGLFVQISRGLDRHIWLMESQAVSP